MQNSLRILVTGGAGYIGSHTSQLLCNSKHDVVVLDNLYSGHRWAVPEAAEFVEGDCADRALVADLHRRFQFDAVIHFAGYVVVPESVSHPERYYRNNVIASLNLIEQVRESGIRHIVFSSSAAVYGLPQILPATENSPTEPINPYGRSKLITEWTLKDLAHAASLADQQPFRFAALRYFNVAGAALDGSIGQATPNATHLIKVACETAVGRRESMRVFGTDYDTPDGTCIRDYIHVMDLADAHLRAIEYLAGGGESGIFNCGYGRGFSVYQVIDAVRKASGREVNAIDSPRRPGDPATVVADNSLIRERLGWTPKYQDLDLICQSAWDWECKLQNMGQGMPD